MTKNLPRYECLLAAAKALPDLDPWACAVYLHLLPAGTVKLSKVGYQTAHHATHGRA